MELETKIPCFYRGEFVQQTKALKSQKGFAMISLIFLMPLILSGFTFIFFQSGYILTFDKAQMICQQQVSQTQRKLGDILKKLIKLNPKATRLRKQRKWARANLAAATASGYPPTIALAQAYRTYVHLSQLAFAVKQKALLAQAKMVSLSGRTNIREKLRNEFVHQIERQKVSSIKLQVTSRPKLSLTPNYHPVPGFSLRQKISSKWEINLWKQLPKFVQRMFGLYIDKRYARGFSIKGSCAATLTKRGRDWIVTLRNY